MIFEVLMNKMLINIFVQFVARNVTFNFIDLMYCVCMGGLKESNIEFRVTQLNIKQTYEQEFYKIRKGSE